MELTFRVAKLLEYADQVEQLEASDNPFAAVVLAHCKTLETRKDPESRRAWKLRVVKGLYRRNWSKDDIRQLFRVIDWMMALPEDLEASFDLELDKYEQENKMEYVTSRERLALKRSEERGHQKGLVEGISLTLDARFGPSGLRLLRKVRAMEDVQALRKFAQFLKKAESIEEVRAYFN